MIKPKQENNASNTVKPTVKPTVKLQEPLAEISDINLSIPEFDYLSKKDFDIWLDHWKRVITYLTYDAEFNKQVLKTMFNTFANEDLIDKTCKEILTEKLSKSPQSSFVESKLPETRTDNINIKDISINMEDNEFPIIYKARSWFPTFKYDYDFENDDE